MSASIESIRFRHYKALENYSLDIHHINILTGANNSGKSTVLSSLRILAVALRIARRSSPQYISIDNSHSYGYRIKENLVPVSLENVATNYAEGSTKISFLISNGNCLHLIFDNEAGCVLVPETLSGSIKTTADFKKQFPVGLTVIPVLGPVEHKEAIRDVQTVTAALSTHRASRHFRNYWHHFPDGFSEFSELVEQTWPGMKIQRPEITNSSELCMFVSEDRIDRELYWVGFGFQIWCQLLTHLHRADASTMIVIDEPEVYLHPDIQRRLLNVLKGTGAAILVATHSFEIISQAESGEVVRIDKRKSKAEREEVNLCNTRTPHVYSNSFSPTTPMPQQFPADEHASNSLSKMVVPFESVPKVVAIVDSVDLSNGKGDVKKVSSVAIDAPLKTAGATLKLTPNVKPFDSSQCWDDVKHDVQSASSACKSLGDSDDSRFHQELDSIPTSPSQVPRIQISSRSQNEKMVIEEPNMDSLLMQAKRLGIKLDDQRHKPGGAIYAALYETPDEPARILLKGLLNLGFRFGLVENI